MSTRLDVKKTYKLFIGGKFPRSESGRYPWFELRATMMGEEARAHRCLGLSARLTLLELGEGTRNGQR